jgi:hypothetical protein
MSREVSGQFMMALHHRCHCGFAVAFPYISGSVAIVPGLKRSSSCLKGYSTQHFVSGRGYSVIMVVPFAINF